MSDVLPRVREHRKRRERLERAASRGAGRALGAPRGPRRRGDDHGLRGGDAGVPRDERADRIEGLPTLVREGDRRRPGRRHDPLHDPDARGQPPAGRQGRGDRRVGNTTMAMSSDEYNQMLFERIHSERRWENQPADDWSMDDLDLAEIRRTVAEAVRRGRMAEPPSSEPSDLLRVESEAGIQSHCTNIGINVQQGRNPDGPLHPQCEDLAASRPLPVPHIEALLRARECRTHPGPRRSPTTVLKSDRGRPPSPLDRPGGPVDPRARLENRRAFRRTVGSNPTPSAKTLVFMRLGGARCRVG